MCEEIYVLKKRLEIQSALLDKFKKELKVLPKGTLICKTRKNNKVYFYQQYGVCSNKKGQSLNNYKKDINNHRGNLNEKEKKKFKQRYIKRSEIELLEKLKRKKIIKECMHKLEENISLLKDFISKYHKSFPECTITKLTGEYQDIREQYYLEFGIKDIDKWEKADYDKNPKYSEGLIHRTTKGELVRSKSEAIIASQLHLNGIPYHYEEQLQIEDKTFYPDFTIMRPPDGKIIYWEHFGLLTDEEYVNNIYEKLLIFAEHGIVLWDNLIITFDKPTGSIDVLEIQTIIKAKFF